MLKSKTLIMIPAYNAEEFISRSIDSCLHQTMPTEIWVVDNCSTDKTQQIVKTYEKKDNRVKLIINDKNYGRVGNWNRCLEIFEQSEFEYLKFLFTGDELLPECIEEVEKIFLQEDNISLVVWPYIFKEKNGKQRIVKKFTNNIKLNKFDLVKLKKFPFGNGVPGAIVCHTFAKKAIYGLRFNEEHLGLIAFSNKLINNGDFYHIDQPLSIFNLDGHNSFTKQFNYLNDLEIAFNRATGLENEKDWIDKEDYESIKFDILKNLILSLEKQDSRILEFLEFLVNHRKNR